MKLEDPYASEYGLTDNITKLFNIHWSDITRHVIETLSVSTTEAIKVKGKLVDVDVISLFRLNIICLNF